MSSEYNPIITIENEHVVLKSKSYLKKVFLQMLQSPETMRIVSVVGRYRSGKSHLLNTLISTLENTTGEYFPVGHEVDACTKGIHAYYHTRTNTLFLDIEGLGSSDNSEVEEFLLVASALYLSTHIVLNVKEKVSNSDVNMLHMIMESEFVRRPEMPAFIIAIRDAELGIRTKEGYLQDILQRTGLCGMQWSSCKLATFTHAVWGKEKFEKDVTSFWRELSGENKYHLFTNKHLRTLYSEIELIGKKKLSVWSQAQSDFSATMQNATRELQQYRSNLKDTQYSSTTELSRAIEQAKSALVNNRENLYAKKILQDVWQPFAKKELPHIRQMHQHRWDLERKKLEKERRLEKEREEREKQLRQRKEEERRQQQEKERLERRLKEEQQREKELKRQERMVGSDPYHGGPVRCDRCGERNLFTFYHCCECPHPGFDLCTTCHVFTTHAYGLHTMVRVERPQLAPQLSFASLLNSGGGFGGGDGFRVFFLP